MQTKIPIEIMDIITMNFPDIREQIILFPFISYALRKKIIHELFKHDPDQFLHVFYKHPALFAKYIACHSDNIHVITLVWLIIIKRRYNDLEVWLNMSRNSINKYPFACKYYSAHPTDITLNLEIILLTKYLNLNGCINSKINE